MKVSRGLPDNYLPVAAMRRWARVGSGGGFGVRLEGRPRPPREKAVATSLTRRSFVGLLAGSMMLAGLLVGCGGGGGGTFVDTSAGSSAAAPTNVTGQSNTSGLGAGAALQSPGQSDGGANGTPAVTPTVTRTPTVTPTPKP